MSNHENRSFGEGGKAEHIRQTAYRIIREATRLMPLVHNIGHACQLKDARNAAGMVLSINLDGLPETTFNIIGKRIMDYETMIVNLMAEYKAEYKELPRNDSFDR